MRDMVFKNLTSDDKKRKILVSSEVMDNEGTRSVIHRHFICLVREVKEKKEINLKPSLYVLKEHNTREQKEKFACRIKGSMYAAHNGRLFLVVFLHSLKIILTRVPVGLA